MTRKKKRVSHWINLFFAENYPALRRFGRLISYGRPSTIGPIVAERMGRDMKTRSPRLGYRPYNPYVDRHTNETSKRT